MNLELLDPEVQEYLNRHKATPIAEFIFKGSPFPHISIQELAQQLEGKRKVKRKLPLWNETSDILFPPKLNLEQTSSQTTAQYKADLLAGTTIADGTGGYGIDVYYFSKTNDQVLHIEKNETLSELAKHNASVLGIENVQFITGDSIDYFLNTSQTFDTIYLDPGRRTEAKGKVFMLNDCLPNVPLYKKQLLKKCKNLWVKTAPLLDITAGLIELENVTEIHIVAVNNEVKELLWKINTKRSSNPQLVAVNLISSDPTVRMSMKEMATAVPNFSEPLTYLYEPNAALMKSGAFNLICSRFDVAKLEEHAHLYTSADLKNFPGRRFQLLETILYSKKSMKKLGIVKANITTRNFPVKVETLRKKHKIKEGGDTYLFFTTLYTGDLAVLRCAKISA